MKQSNFTILEKLTRQNIFLPKTNFFIIFFTLTMLVGNMSLFAKNKTANFDIFLSATYETCTGSSDGSVSVVVAGGTPSYTYEWNTGATTDNVYDLTSGTYRVTVTDSQGDIAIDSIDVELSPEGLWIMVSTTQDAGCGPNGIAHVSAMTGVPPYTYLWDDPAMQTTEDAINLYPGLYHVSVTDSNGCTATDSTFVAGEDGTSLGDFVWLDLNKDGIQNSIEPGVGNVYVALQTAGPDGILFTDDDPIAELRQTDNSGHYIFDCVDPGQYYITFAPDANVYNFSDPYQGNDDELDSNADPITGSTASFVVFQNMPDDLSYDAGIYYACDDFTNGGTIGQNQIICPGDDAETLGTVIPPTGGSGAIEYLWLKSTSGDPFPSPSWMEIPNSNIENYDPGILFTTTYYIRCVRREGCISFLIESENYVTITVLSEDDEYCDEGNIDPFDPDISADIMADEEVMINWTTGPENELYYYYIERSFDSANFEAIAVMRGTANSNSSNDYHFMDNEPMNGRNVYRVKRVELVSEETFYSNSVEIFFVDSEKSFMVHPNPVSEVLKVETSYPRSKATTLSLYSTMGQLLGAIEIAAGETFVELNMKNYASGIYFIHIPGDTENSYKIMRILKN